MLPLLLCFWCGWARGQPRLQTLWESGPVSNRFNIVFLSEGYTTGELASFAADATNALNAFLARQPFAEYRNCFNAFAISVASSESGSDHPAYGVYRNTYFNSRYDAVSDRLITIPPNVADANYAHGQGKVDALLKSLLPSCHLPVLLVNDLAPGGSDGGLDKTAIAYAGPGLGDVLLHETGHVIAGLGDEYTNAYSGYPAIEEPNTTREARSNYIKWRAWIPGGVPIPTPATPAYTGVVGLFRGGHYSASDWYRPKFDCCMNHSATAEFCEVCTEALVLSLYRKARPIDSFSPTQTNLLVSATEPLRFSVGVLEPMTHRLNLEWQLDGKVQQEETNGVFWLRPDQLDEGKHLLEVRVRDLAPLVRNDPNDLLSQTLAWTVDVDIQWLAIDSVALYPGNRVGFRIRGSAPRGAVLEHSADLLSWSLLSTNLLTGGECWCTNAMEATTRFFRASAR